VRRSQGRLDAALAHFRIALEIRTAALGEKHPHVGESLLGIGEVLAAQGSAGAAGALERAVRNFEAGGVPPHILARARFALARNLARTGAAPERVRQIAQEARAAYARAGPSRRADLARLDAWIARYGRK
jgi:hypothetical protein